MIPVQPILILLLASLAVLYFMRLRSKAADGLIILLVFTCALVLIIRPDFATRLAQIVGVGRGVDLIFYIAVPGLAFLILVLSSKIRALDVKITAMIREDSLADAHDASEEADSGR